MFALSSLVYLFFVRLSIVKPSFDYIIIILGGDNMSGAEVREMIQSAGFKLWQVAELWGISDGNFSRRLRKPFSDEEVERIKAIIAELHTKKSA